MAVATNQTTEGDDILDLDRSAQSLIAGSGDDLIRAIKNGVYDSFSVHGGAGEDTFYHAGTLKLDGTAKFNQMEILDVGRVKVKHNATIDLSDFDTSTAERISGSSGNETIIGTKDADLVYAGKGDDVVHASKGDVVHMGQGNDTLVYVDDGTAVLDVNAKGNGTITYGDGSVIAFTKVENFEVIDGNVEYVIDFDGYYSYSNGSATGEKDFISVTTQSPYSFFQSQFQKGEYDASADGDSEAFITYGGTAGFAREEGEEFEFASVSLANGAYASSQVNSPDSLAHVVQVRGYNDGEVIFSRDVALTFEHVVHEFDWAGIDMIEFDPIGGNITTGEVVDNGMFSIDDVTLIA